MFGQFASAARARQLGASGVTLALVAAAAVVGFGVTAPAPAGAGCAAPPATTLRLVGVNGHAPSATGARAGITAGDTLLYRLTAVSGCRVNRPFTITLSFPAPAGTTYAGRHEGWVFGARTAAATGTQLVTVPGRGSIAKQFTVRVDASSRPRVITATATSSAGSCDCAVTTGVTGASPTATRAGPPTGKPSSPPAGPQSGSQSGAPAGTQTGPPTATPAAAGTGVTPSATITLADSVTGRTVPADQFTLTLRDPAAAGTAALVSLVTAATQTSATTKPVTVAAGQPYDVEVAIGAGSSSELADYTTSISCRDGAGAFVATSGATPTWTVTAAADASVTCVVSETPPPLDCTTGGTLFGLTTTQDATQLVAAGIGSGKTNSIGPAYPKHASGLGVTADGSRAFFVDSDGTMMQYSASTGSFTPLLDSGVTGVTVGAVDPVDGNYYFGTATALYRYDPAGNTVSLVGAFSAAPSGLTFDRSGDGYVVSSGVLSTFPLPAAGSTAGLVTSALISQLPAASGLAFGVDGYVYLATGDGVQRFDPTTGSSAGGAGAGSPALSDLTGCGGPYLLTVATSEPRGPFSPTDQFGATISGGAIAAPGTVHLLGTPGPSYTVTETMLSGDPATYTIAWSCADTVSSSIVATGTGLTGTFTLGRTPAGADVTCTFVNTALIPAILRTTTKLISTNGGGVPAAGVTTGDVLSYQVSVSNSGQWPGATTVHEQIPAGTSYSGLGEGWSVTNGGAALTFAVGPGATSTATFTVTVGRLPANTRTIDERASTSSGDCVGCSISTATQAVLTTTLTLVAVDGTALAPGQTLGPADRLQYRFVLTNSGGTTGSTVLTEPVPANTAYTGTAAEGWSINDAVATRSLTAAGGRSASATFTVTVDNPLQIGTTQITNQASVSVGPCACTVTAAVPAFAAAVTASTSRAHLGDTVTYTVLVRNNGSVDYTADNPAIVGDDLSGLLDDAHYNDDANRGGVFAGNVITWRVALPAGTLIALTFTVTINTPDLGDKQLFDVIATAIGTGGNCPAGSKDPDCLANTVGLLSYQTTLSASTAIAHPGDVVTYTVAVENTGSLAYTESEPARFSIDLAGVVDDGAYQDDASGAAAHSGETLSWSLAVPAGHRVSVTFSVLIARPDTGDNRLALALLSPAGQGGNCGPGPATTACDPAAVIVSAFTVTMTASAGVVRPGQKVTYTVSVANTGGLAFTAADPAAVAVDLGGLLDDAGYGGDANNGATYSSSTITWRVALAIGVARSFTFSMLLKGAGTGDGILLGQLLTAPGGNCPTGSTGPVCWPAPAALQAYTAAIAADRSAATNGDRVTYEVTIRNAGTIAYSTAEPARFSNNIGGVLDDASVAGAPSAPATIVGSTISWKSALPVGATLTVTYSVTVARPDTGDGILTAAVATAAGLGGSCGPGPAPVACTSRVLISSLSLIARAVPVTMRDPGNVITYVYTVTNTGHLPIAGVRLMSVNFSGTNTAPDLAGCGSALGAVPVGASKSCELTYTVTAADIQAGVITLAAVAQGSDQTNPVIASNVSTGLVTLVAPLTLSIKAITTDVNGDGVIDPGDRVDWTISATDTGIAALTNLTVRDSLGAASCDQTALQRDAVADCTVATYTIPPSAADSALVDTAVATGTQVDGAEVGALQTTFAVEVLSPPSEATTVRGSATARLALIVFVTLLALGGLFLLAGWRSHQRVRRT